MKILVLAYYIKGDGHEGGSGRFMRCVADTLINMGHEVVTSTEPEKHVDKHYDLIICSHFLYRIEDNPAPKIYIAHGIIDNERLYTGAQKYVSISEEIKKHNLKYGIYSEVINQPIVIQRQKRPGNSLKNILVIRRQTPEKDPFAFLADRYNLKYSDPNVPIEDQIEVADLCITLGRGALESMAQGKPVLVADNRDYMGAIGDGYVTKENIHEIAKHNFSGRRYKLPLTQEWIEGELAKYNPLDSDFVYEYISENHEASKIVKQYLGMIKPELTTKQDMIPGLISIIIPVYNEADMSYECIQAVIENTNDIEVIVVDNGSNPPFKPQFSGFIEIRTIRNNQNMGFPVAVNQGLHDARGEFIVLLNNDVIVTPRSINRLVEWLKPIHFEATEDEDRYYFGSQSFDIVGPVTNYCAGLQKVQLPSYQSIDELNQEANALFESSEGECEEVNWIIGFCMAFRRSLWEEVGDFDASLWPCSGEEIDFALRAKEKGYKIGIAYDIYVHHKGSITFRDLQDEGQFEYIAICKRNEQYLEEKWGSDVWNKQAIIEEIETFPTSGINLNLGCGYHLVEGYVNIDNRSEVNPDLICDVIEGLPYPDNSVDSIRAHDFLEHIPIGKTIGVMNEIWRVLKPGGIFDSLTPSTDGRGAFQDPTHVSFWNQNSWRYYSDEVHRNLYGITANFEIQKIEDITIDDPTIIYTHVVAITKKEPVKADIPDGPLRLNLGCGKNKLKGFVNIDQLQHVNPDIVANAISLPYEPGTVDEIYCGHLLEHFSWDDGQNALKYWHDLLKPGGLISVTVPDFDVILQRYLANPSAQEMKGLNDLYFYSYVQESLHKYTYNEPLLKVAMSQAGFVKLGRLPIDDPHFSEPVDWQIGYRGEKL